MNTLSSMAMALALVLLPGAGMAVGRGDEEGAARQAIARYPEEIREAVCEVAGHPELLVRLARTQQETSAEFAELLEPYGRRDQEALWDLARFPGLIEALAEADSRDDQQLNEVLDQYPAEVGPTARKYARREPGALAEIAALHRQTEARFSALLSAYPPQTQAQARLLVQHPEVLDLLETELDQVILLGDAYRQDPDRVRQQLAQQHLERGSAPALRPRPGRSEEPGPPPSSRARRYDYDLNNLDEPEEARVEVVYHRSYWDYPYPYWFGYPRWYGPASWYLGFNWHLTPHVSAAIGVEVPVVRRVVPVYRPYYRRYEAGGWGMGGHGHWSRRGRRH
jgi:hypothetical protein